MFMLTILNKIKIWQSIRDMEIYFCVLISKRYLYVRTLVFLTMFANLYYMHFTITSNVRQLDEMQGLYTPIVFMCFDDMPPSPQGEIAGWCRRCNCNRLLLPRVLHGSSGLCCQRNGQWRGVGWPSLDLMSKV